MVPSATPARSAISATREWKNPCSAMTSMAASRMRWYLSEVPFMGLAAGSERFTVKEASNLLGFARERNGNPKILRLLGVPLQKPAKSLAAMAVLPLLLQRELAKGLAKRTKLKKRIVAETSRAPGAGQQFTRRLTLERGQRLSVTGKGDDANVFSGMFSGRQTC